MLHCLGEDGPKKVKMQSIVQKNAELQKAVSKAFWPQSVQTAYSSTWIIIQMLCGQSEAVHSSIEDETRTDTVVEEARRTKKR